MNKDEPDKFESSVMRRLDIIVILLLAQKDISQKDIAKILGVSDHRIQDIFGKHYTKIQQQNVQNGIKKKTNKIHEKESLSL